jgi:hypothetical protein
MMLGLVILIGMTSACADGQGPGTESGGIVGTPTPGVVESQVREAPVRARVSPSDDTRVESVAANPTSTNALPEATTVPTVTPRPQSPTAADTFDPDGLMMEAGSGFIPLDEPVMIPATEATWLDDGEIVMGLVANNGETRAFPVRQMAYHHIANLTVGGEPYLVTY